MLVAYGLLCLCVVRCVFVGKECLLVCGVSDDRCIDSTFVRWLFGGFLCAIVVVVLGNASIAFSV